MNTRSSAAEETEARLICRHTARLVEAAREIAPDYARRSAPVGSYVVSQLLRAKSCTLTFADLDESCAGLTLPAVSGVYTVVINNDESAADAVVTIRHELGHVMAGDVDEPTFMDDHDLSWTERVADLFALADVIPAGMIRNWMAPGRPRWAQLTRDIAGLVAGFAPGWSERRTADRARLRVLLYRERGI